MALLVAIEGIDGSGKGTQAAKLHARLQQSNCDSRLISFPRYEETFFGRAVGDFLNGKFGSLDEVNPFLVSLLYAGDRFESRDFLHDTIHSHDIVVLDRYVPSNIAHQAAKLDHDERNALLKWVETIEFEIYQLPRPSVVILLDLPAETAQKLIATKQARSYTSRKADLQEADGAYLESVRRVYLELAASNSSWQTIECLSEDSLRTVDEISDEIWSIIAPRLDS